QRCRNAGNGILEERCGAPIVLQKQFHLVTQFRVRAILGKKGRTLVGRDGDCRLKQPLYVGVHLLTSLRSQAWARRSCRCTVWTGTFTQVEISSAVIPPKKRISTMRDLRSSSTASRSSASLTASTVMELSDPNSNTSVIPTFSPPSRLAACRERAWSTRIWRMILAATP